jgi:hypothetical protein
MRPSGLLGSSQGDDDSRVMTSGEGDASRKSLMSAAHPRWDVRKSSGREAFYGHILAGLSGPFRLAFHAENLPAAVITLVAGSSRQPKATRQELLPILPTRYELNLVPGVLERLLGLAHPWSA